MSNLPPDLNPYASPAAPDELMRQPIVSSYELLKEVKQFRAEIHALGGLWIVAGTVPLGMAGLYVLAVFDVLESSVPPEALVLSGFFAMIGLPFVVCGIGTCYKQLWAVYIGLVASYLMTVLSLLGLNPCIVVAYASGIFGGHRIIGWANSLRRKGIPITIRPRDIQTPLQLPAMFPPDAVIDLQMPTAPGESAEWPK